MEVPAGGFKAHCLQLIEAVRAGRLEIVITKRGHPVAKLVPLQEAAPRPLLGYLTGTVTVTGDIEAPLGEAWEADREP